MFMVPAFVIYGITVVSLTCAVFFYGTSFLYGFRSLIKKAGLLFLLFIFQSPFTFSQTGSAKDSPDTSILEPVTVTAFGGTSKWKDAPAAVAIISKTRLHSFDDKSLVPVLNTVPGVRMEERSPGSYRLSIRGSLLRSPFGVRNIKIYWNDIPLTDAAGNTYLNLIDISQLTSLEIIKGPASSMYGANTGGAILLKTNTYFNNNTVSNYFSANIETGSYDLLNEQINYNRQSENFAFSLQQSHFKSDGYRQQSTMRKDALQGNFKWKISNKEQLSGLLFYTNLHYETPGGITKSQMDSLPILARQPTPTLPGAVQQKAGVYNKTGFAGFTLHSGFGGGWVNTTVATMNHTSFKNPFITNYEHRDEMNYGARTVFELNTVRLKWLTGAELLQNISHISNRDNLSGAPGNLQYEDKVHVLQYFIFTQLNFEYRNFTLQAGVSANRQLLKYNRISDSVFNYWQQQNTNVLIAPRLSAIYSISKPVSFYGIISKGFSPPTLAEVRPSTNLFYDLQPEYGWNMEGGIKGSILKSRLEFDASLYSFNLHHAIVVETDSTGADYFLNAGGTKQTGAEIWLSLALLKNEKKFFQTISLSNSFSCQPYKFRTYFSGSKNLSGNSLTGVPKNMDIITIDIFTKPGIYLTSNFNYTSSIPLTDANDVYAASYSLWQLKLGFKKQIHKAALNVYAGVDNILNETYSLGNDLNAFGGRFFNPAPKRNFFTGLKIEL